MVVKAMTSKGNGHKQKVIKGRTASMQSSIRSFEKEIEAEQKEQANVMKNIPNLRGIQDH